MCSFGHMSQSQNRISIRFSSQNSSQNVPIESPPSVAAGEEVRGAAAAAPTQDDPTAVAAAAPQVRISRSAQTSSRDELVLLYNFVLIREQFFITSISRKWIDVVQGDRSGCSLGVVDIITNVAFY